MARARLTVTTPDGSWAGRVTRSHPDAHIRVRTASVGEPATLVAEVTAPSLAPVIAAISEADGVRSLDILDRHGDTAVCRLTVADAGPLAAAAAAGAPPEYPFTVADGTIEWELTATRSALADLADELSERGLEFTVAEMRPGDDGEPLLTPRQRTVVRTAVDSGYYEVPRGCSLATVAEQADLSKSTCSEILRRAEKRLLTRYLDGGQP
ncbi:helix-turn-helix domain-containing protein [Halosegnis rubeus]|uniref:Helix-turn-helix domain-containing protein n=1 Tax=Halosegnis rubeus TaxID=2212850 RepID=A0A5N5ULG2_9EURY|nr:helix-turn-helix domain-containing protein [Halosegnis rubeus]KAB7519708.1 helix-turn-helix domain-containing protein [Halosegnis rubeus]